MFPFSAVVIYRGKCWLRQHHVPILPRLLRLAEHRPLAGADRRQRQHRARLLHLARLRDDRRRGEDRPQLHDQPVVGTGADPQARGWITRGTAWSARRWAITSSSASAAAIMGTITIGDNVRIGANSIVIHDVPNDTRRHRHSGAPARHERPGAARDRAGRHRLTEADVSPIWERTSSAEAVSLDNAGAGAGSGAAARTSFRLLTKAGIGSVLDVRSEASDDEAALARHGLRFFHVAGRRLRGAEPGATRRRHRLDAGGDRGRTQGLRSLSQRHRPQPLRRLRRPDGDRLSPGRRLPDGPSPAALGDASASRSRRRWRSSSGGSRSSAPPATT